jgi:hypothetical protein
MGGLPDFERIDPDRLGDVLELGQAEIGYREIKPRLHLAIGVLGQTNCAGFGDALDAGGDIDAVAHEIAVGLLDHVAEMDADAKFDALVGRDLSVARYHRSLDFNGAVHRVDDTAELDDAAVARALDDAPWWTAMVGSIRSLRSDRSRARIRSSSAPVSRE